MNAVRLLAVLAVLMGITTISEAQDSFDFTLRRIEVPILMYHYVSELPEDADPFRVELTVETDVFRSHMQVLRDDGYTPISFYDLEAALNHGVELPEKPIILTFDDGHLDHYVNVFPILREFGFIGTFFLITSRVDDSDPVYMNWSQVQEMAAAGMSMEAHTKNHISLRERNPDVLTYEIVGSIESIEVHTGIRPRIFSYPVGHYDALTLDFLDTTNVQRAVTTQLGTAHTTTNRLEVSRLRVSGNTSAAGLRYLLTTDWD